MFKFTAHDVGGLALIAMMFGAVPGTVALQIYGTETAHLWYAIGVLPFAVIALVALMYDGYKHNWR